MPTLKPQEYLESIREAASFLRSRAPGFEPRAAVVLGSGLSEASPELSEAKTIPYGDIPGFPPTTVSGHSGRITLGRLRGDPGSAVAVLQGRFHFYEGHSMESITLPVRALHALGLKTLILTAAVGSLRRGLAPGHVIVLKDHVNFMGHNPLRGFHEKEFGSMFPDLADAYDPALRKLALAQLRRLKIPAREGVYVASPGPSYETPAEVRAFRALGGDVVGMSVVPEAIVARQLGVRVLGLSWVSNMAAGLSKTILSHAEVLELGQNMSRRLREALDAILPKL